MNPDPIPLQPQPLPPSVIGFGLALSLSSVASALLVIAKESSPNGVMPFMKRLTGHHWSTHSAFALVLFLVFGLIFTRANAAGKLQVSPRGFFRVFLTGIFFSAALIAGFYLFGD